MRITLRKKYLGICGIIFYFLFASGSAYAEQNALKAISVTVLPERNTQIELRFSRPLIGLPSHFDMPLPPRLVLDFTHIETQLDKPSQQVNRGMVLKYTTVQ